MLRHNLTEIYLRERFPHSGDCLCPFGIGSRLGCFPSQNSPEEHNLRPRPIYFEKQFGITLCDVRSEFGAPFRLDPFSDLLPQRMRLSELVKQAARLLWQSLDDVQRRLPALQPPLSPTGLIRCHVSSDALKDCVVVRTKTDEV